MAGKKDLVEGFQASIDYMKQHLQQEPEIGIALNYDSSESFSKAFQRFHGIAPPAAAITRKRTLPASEGTAFQQSLLSLSKNHS